jgi:hypothetical protein
MSKTRTATDEGTTAPDAPADRPHEDGATDSDAETAGGGTDADEFSPAVETVDGTWGVAVALGIAGIAFVVGSPVLLVGATIPLWYTAVASLGRTPETGIGVHRTVAVESDAVDAARR